MPENTHLCYNKNTSEPIFFSRYTQRLDCLNEAVKHFNSSPCLLLKCPLGFPFPSLRAQLRKGLSPEQCSHLSDFC